MSASGFTPIQLYRTTTASAAPSAGNLADGELAINLTDEKLYFKNASGVVKLLASNSGSLGSVTSVAASGGTTGLTFSGSPITSSGTLTLGGTLTVANGGTGQTSLTAGYLLKGNGTSAIGSSIVYDNGTNVGIGTASPSAKLQVRPATDVNFWVTQFSGAVRTVAVNDAVTGYIDYIHEANTHQFYAGNSERVRITSTGDVGIGTSSPAAKLDVNGTGTMLDLNLKGNGTEGGQLALSDKDNTYGAYYFDVDGGGNGRVYTITNNANLTLGQLGGTGGNVLVATSGAERMRIDSIGNVGIGTSSPAAKLDVVGGVRSTALTLENGSPFQPQANIANYSADATGGYVIFNKSRAGYTASQNGDTLGTILWYGYDSANVRVATSSIVTTQTAASGSGAVPTALVFNNGGNNERMRIDNSGNVGIGTGSPNAKLDVVGDVKMGAALSTGTGVSTGDCQIELGAHRTGDGASYIDWHATAGTDYDLRLARYPGANGGVDFLNTGTGNFSIGQLGAAPLLLLTGGTERMRIASNGNVGIGTSSPGYKLAVNGGDFIVSRGSGATAADAAINFGGNVNNYIYSGNSSNIMAFATNGSERMRINSAGNVGIGTSNPQAILHVRPATDVNLWTTNDGTTLRTLAINDGISAYINWRRDAYQHTFETGGTERLRIDLSGNVGIGTTSPNHKLDVNGAIGFTPGSSVTPVDNGDVVFELTNNTTLTVKAKGSDGVVRSATLTLA